MKLLKTLIVGLLFQNLLGCSDGFHPLSGVGSGSNSLSSSSDVNSKALQVLQTRCASCHDSQNAAQTGLTFVNDLAKLANSSFVVPGNPGLSPLYQRIAGGTMPPGSPLNANDTQAVAAWITSLATQPTPTPVPTPTPIPTPTPTPTPTPKPTPTPNFATYSYISQNILPKCTGCHGTSGGYSYTSYTNTLKSVQPMNPAGSKFYTAINSGIMPRGGSKLSATDIKAVFDWITLGAPNN